MDLSWCIICDNRIEDDELSMDEFNNSLYCSQECKLKDEQQEQQEEETKTDTSSYFNMKSTFGTQQQQQVNRPSLTTKKLAKYYSNKLSTTSNTTSYPWIPLYRKRHQINYLLNTSKRCCQPVVAGSPITANAFILSSSPASTLVV